MKKSEQALIVHLKLSDDELGTSNEQRQLFELEKKMRETIDDQALGNDRTALLTALSISFFSKQVRPQPQEISQSWWLKGFLQRKAKVSVLCIALPN